MSARFASTSSPGRVPRSWRPGTDGRRVRAYGHLRWRYWNRGAAAASGADWIDNCTPDCADGRFSAYRATLYAFRPRGGHFTRLTEHYHYHDRNDVLRFDIVGNQYIEQ